MVCRPSHYACILLLVLGAISAPATGQQEIEPIEVGETPNLSHHDEAVYFGGQPAAGDFASFAQRGVKTVINLRTAGEVESLDFDEKTAVESAGMRYVHVPIGREPPSEQTLSLLMDLLEDEENRPVLLHCGSSNRVGYVWALYQGERQGKSVDEAVAEGKAAGLRSSALEERVREFLAGQGPQ